MRNLVIAGRILFGGLLVYAGIMDLNDIKIMAQITGSKGMPFPTLSVAVAATILILDGLSIAANCQIKIGVLLAWIFLVPVTLIIHNFWAFEDPMARGNEMAHFLKNILILAGVLVFLSLPAPNASQKPAASDSQ